MDVKKIVIIIIVIIIIAIISYRLRQNMINSPLLIPTISDGNTQYNFNKNRLTLAPINGGLEYTFSFWIYISNWSYRYGLDKIITFWKGRPPSGPTGETLEKICKEIEDKSYYEKNKTKKNNDQPTSIKETCKDCKQGNLLEDFENPKPNSKKLTGILISLGKSDNSLIIKQTLIDGKHSVLKIKNLPIQKWLNMTVILQLRNLDVFINGKLKGSKRLSTLPTFQDGDLLINPNGGFDGYISKFQYFNRKIKSGEIRKIFHRGPKNWNPFTNNKVGVMTESSVMDIVSNFTKPNKLIRGLKKAGEKISKKIVNDKYPMDHLCHTNDDCKKDLMCLQGKCGFKDQSRHVNQSCFSKSNCKVGLSCNNHGTDKLSSTQIKDLQKIGIPINKDSSFNSKLGDKPFTCTYPQ